jgi:Dolichyl-phosphate-mannose-protein mannosyltransferase
MSPKLNHAQSARQFDFAATGIVILWYFIVYFAVRPLTEAPVGDSWIYEHAVTHFNRTGKVQFPGFTQAMPVVQALYGAAWSRLFGETSRSLDLSTALLAIFGGLLFYRLARKCGAAPWPSIAATALLICNPCYLLMSFSFMTEIPFLVALLASYFAFACAIQHGSKIWLWLAAAFAVAGFGVRPFAGATIVSEAAALLMCTGSRRRTLPSSNLIVLIPLIAALLVCAGFWAWLTFLSPKPWMLQYHQYQLRNYLSFVPLRHYADWGFLEPALYLGTALSPLAVLHAIQSWRRSIPVSAAILALSIMLTTLNREHVWNLEQFGCFGGSASALVLNGVRPQSGLPIWLGWILVGLGSAGIAGIWNTLRHTIRQANPTIIAVLLAGAIYWAAISPLWLFGDRYDLILVPPACLLLATAPLPRCAVAIGAAALMTAALAFVSVGGLVSYHRTMQEIVMETDALLRQGIPRKQIDAGYALNGRDLYVYPAQGIDTARDEPPIPLITSPATLPYVISTSLLPNTIIWRRFSGCGGLGFGRRPLFVLKANTRSLSP